VFEDCPNCGERTEMYNSEDGYCPHCPYIDIGSTIVTEKDEENRGMQQHVMINYKKFGLRKPVLKIGTRLVRRSGDSREHTIVSMQEAIVRRRSKNKRKLFYVLDSGLEIPAGKLRYYFRILEDDKGHN